MKLENIARVQTSSKALHVNTPPKHDPSVILMSHLNFCYICCHSEVIPRKKGRTFLNIDIPDVLLSGCCNEMIYQHNIDKSVKTDVLTNEKHVDCLLEWNRKPNCCAEATNEEY